MNENMQIVFGLLGGLAIFIYGMNMMSECLQKAAGEKMKSDFGVTDKESGSRCACRCAYNGSICRAAAPQRSWQSDLSVQDL